MMEWIFCFIKTYQTISVGILGFTGVVLTMLANAKMQRSQHKRKLDHEANSLRVAFKTELVANKQAYELRVRQLQEETEYNVALIPNKLIDNIYTKLTSNIGVLTEIEVENIIHAYTLMSDMLFRIRIVVGTDKIGGFNDEFISVEKGKQELVLGMYNNLLPILTKAITGIEARLKTA